eukprot:TRINITY_DN430_c2_g1_i1.p1 TRINITY_DN430_c2_g1~~TRINITY_DN430_c2_g1_i1.p1  ORF type:complete len:194 (+),score=79.58 TRINITY_DN430_c2_g1_i1:48-629(+)
MGKAKKGQPKRSLSAFMVFANEKRAEVKEENPEMKLGEISKEIGKMWNELDDDDKTPYQEKAAVLKEEYLEKLEEWKENHVSESDDSSDDGKKKKKKKTKKKKDPNAPKRPATAYFIWLSRSRASIVEEYDLKGKPASQVAKKAGELWKELDEDDDDVISAKEEAARQKKEYAQKLAEYNAKDADSDDDSGSD